MTGITFTPVELDTRHGDRTGVLVFRAGRLMGILSCLDAAHGELAGRWFVEKTFHEIHSPASTTFESPAAFAAGFNASGP